MDWSSANCNGWLGGAAAAEATGAREIEGGPDSKDGGSGVWALAPDRRWKEAGAGTAADELLAAGGGKGCKVLGWRDLSASGIPSRFGTNDEPPIVLGVEGTSKSPGCELLMSFVRAGKPGALRSTVAISSVELTGGRRSDDARDR